VHELSICSSIADIARRRADGRAVSVINVRVGQLRQIVPDTLVYCWSLISEETPLAGSRIVVESVPARIRCRSCEQTADVGDLPVFACAGCGGNVSMPGSIGPVASGTLATQASPIQRSTPIVNVVAPSAMK